MSDRSVHIVLKPYKGFKIFGVPVKLPFGQYSLPVFLDKSEALNHSPNGEDGLLSISINNIELGDL